MNFSFGQLIASIVNPALADSDVNNEAVAR